jgi:hypothetical protein
MAANDAQAQQAHPQMDATARCSCICPLQESFRIEILAPGSVMFAIVSTPDGYRNLPLHSMATPLRKAILLSGDANVIGRVNAGQHAHFHETPT